MRRPATKPEVAPPTREWKAVLLGALLVALVVVVYLPALLGGFSWDDDAYVTNNLTLRSVLGLSQIWGQLTATPQYYPSSIRRFGWSTISGD